ncbi:MAG: Undecaprenyl-phosphate 4-deoxy-4-formamido-L-arabinose transferase [Legionellaceae bacterium]
MKAIYLSVVIPVYNEAGNLPNLYNRLITTLDSIGKPFEIIFTNDGSQDESLTILEKFHQERPEQIRIIDFNGNFGQHKAVMAAFANVRGEVIVTLDADLQNPPEEIIKLLEKIEIGHDYVGGIRRMRHDSFFRRYGSKLNNFLRLKITGIKMEDQGCMLRAYKRNIIDLMVSSNESSTFIPALAYQFSANPIEIEVGHSARESGDSKYNLYRLLRLSFDLMTGFSLLPLQIFTVSGIIVSLLSALFVIYMFLRRIMIGPEAEGLFTLFAILYLLIGLLLMGLGILGEYIGRIYLEVRKRPNYVIRNIIEKID